MDANAIQVETRCFSQAKLALTKRDTSDMFGSNMFASLGTEPWAMERKALEALGWRAEAVDADSAEGHGQGRRAPNSPGFARSSVQS